MKRIIMAILLLVGAAHAQTPGVAVAGVQALPILSPLPGAHFSWTDVRTPYTVIVFLSPECPLSQRYTATLNSLSARYVGPVTVLGVFTGKGDPDADILAFRDKYHVTFPLLKDPDKALVRRLHATVTPEAFLLNANHLTLYRGAIDDKAVSLGNSRPQALHSWLRLALDDALAGRPIGMAHTEPVGCLINDR